MLEPDEVLKYEKRAANALHGYASDENITCYVYGRDMTALLNERLELLKQVATLERHLKEHDPLNMPADGFLVDEPRKVKK